MTKKTTISELKTFIEAVEFAADVESWVPSERQWARIRDMINGLEETPVAAAPQQYVPMQLPQMAHPMANIPMGMESPGVPSGPSSLAATSHTVPHQVMNPRAPIATGNAQIPVRTPDIDTSSGQGYTSSFA